MDSWWDYRAISSELTVNFEWMNFAKLNLLRPFFSNIPGISYLAEVIFRFVFVTNLMTEDKFRGKSERELQRCDLSPVLQVFLEFSSSTTQQQFWIFSNWENQNKISWRVWKVNKTLRKSPDVPENWQQIVLVTLIRINQNKTENCAIRRVWKVKLPNSRIFQENYYLHTPKYYGGFLTFQ